MWTDKNRAKYDRDHFRYSHVKPRICPESRCVEEVLLYIVFGYSVSSAVSMGGNAPMPSTSAEMLSRNFDWITTHELPDEARKAVKAAFEAMSAWCTEIKNSEKSGERVTEKMAVAARALGWPEQIVGATRAQLQSITKMQIQTMDQIMDLWEEQIKSPSSSSNILSKLNSLPSFRAAGSWPGTEAFQQMANPLQAYMSFAEQWQKAWTNAVTSWLQRWPNVVQPVTLPRGMS